MLTVNNFRSLIIAIWTGVSITTCSALECDDGHSGMSVVGTGDGLVTDAHKAVWSRGGLLVPVRSSLMVI